MPEHFNWCWYLGDVKSDPAQLASASGQRLLKYAELSVERSDIKQMFAELGEDNSGEEAADVAKRAQAAVLAEQKQK